MYLCMCIYIVFMMFEILIAWNIFVVTEGEQGGKEGGSKERRKQKRKERREEGRKEGGTSRDCT